jgi:pyridoxal phosphate-dependent aminotransferase EpsN
MVELNKRIYLSPPHLDGRERELLLQAYDSNWITTLGPHVDGFEREVCQRVGIGYGVVLNRAKKTEKLDESLIFVQN